MKLILAITKENEKIIYEVCKENGFETPQVLTGVDSLKRFAIQELKNLNNYKQIIIDVDSTKESEEEIIQSIVAIKSMYNIRVIVVALGHEEGDRLLSKLFNEGIYNFVNAKTYYEQKEQFRNCLSAEGCQYKDAIRFRQKAEETKKNKVIVKKEYKTLKQFVNIAGTEKHIGVTTQAILITIFLKSLNMNACYICSTDKDEIKNIEILEGVTKKDNMYSYRGIDLYSNTNKIDAMQYGYDFYIYDYGTLNENTLDNFSSDEEKAKFKRTLRGIVKNIFFSEYTSDTFNDNVNTEIYHEIFKDYIAEKSNKIEVIEKNSIFNFLKRGKK